MGLTMGRRRFLQALLPGLAVGLAGCGGIEPVPPDDDHDPRLTPRPRPPTDDAAEAIPGADLYGTVVDLVDEGADRTGQRSIVPLLEEYAGDDTLLFLDQGEYLLDEMFHADGVSEFALMGRDATIHVPAGFDTNAVWVRANRGLRVQNVTFEFADGSGGRALHLVAGDGLDVADVTVRGYFDHGRGPVRVDVTDEDGAGVVERLNLPDGAAFDSNATGLLVGSENFGDITFRDCSIQGFPDNGLYAEPPGGAMDVEGGYYANNGISNVRVKGGSTVRGVHVECDANHDPEFLNMRGIRASHRQPRADADPVVVTDCRIELRDVTHSDGAILLASRLGELVVEDTYIAVDADDTGGIYAKAPEADLQEATPRLQCTNVTITGAAARRAAVRVDDRNGCSFDRLRVRQRGHERDGILFNRSNGNTVTDSLIDVTGEPVVLEDSTADVSELVTTRSPPFPFD